MKTLMTSSNLPRWITTAIFAALTLTCGAVSIAADNSDVFAKNVVLDGGIRDQAGRHEKGPQRDPGIGVGD